MNIDYQYIDTDSKAKDAVDFLLQHSRVGLDVESTGVDWSAGAQLLLVQLGTEDVNYLFDPRKINTDVLRPVLESRDILKIIHNAKFEYQALRVGAGIVIRNLFDTMLAYRLLTSGLTEDGKGGYVPAGFRDKSKKQFPYKSLNFLTQKYLGVSLDKSVRESFVNHQYTKEFTEEQLSYAAQDIAVLHPLCDVLSQQLSEQDLIDTALLEFAFVRPVSEMELAGVFINQNKWRQIIEEARRQADGFAQAVSRELSPVAEQNSLFGASVINIDSPDQLLAAFKRLGFEIPNADQKVLKNVQHPVAKSILDYRAYKKLISTYGEVILKKINRTTGRLHFTLHQLGADTGRLSSANPNIQNIPNDKDDPDAEVAISFRDCFQASEGNVILTADYSQCELRILAEVSKDPKFLDIFLRDQDLHIITSQQVFGYTNDDLRIYNQLKDKDSPNIQLEDLFSKEQIQIYKQVGDFRSKTKVINFGIVYGLTAFSLAERFKLPLEEAEQILESYFQTYTGIKRWLDANSRETIANRYAKTILGRKKYFQLADPSDEEMFRRSKGATRRQGNNHVIQGTNADITKEALVRLQEAYDDLPGVKLLFTVHDEIVSECPASMAEHVASIKAEIMREAFHRFIKEVPVGKKDRVSVTIAQHWSK